MCHKCRWKWLTRQSQIHSVEDPFAVEREGQEGRHENDERDRPPSRAAELLDQQPDEELVGEEAEAVDDEEADRALGRTVAAAVAAEAEAAVQDIADAGEEEEDEGEREHRLDAE